MLESSPLHGERLHIAPLPPNAPAFLWTPRPSLKKPGTLVRVDAAFAPDRLPWGHHPRL